MADLDAIFFGDADIPPHHHAMRSSDDERVETTVAIRGKNVDDKFKMFRLKVGGFGKNFGVFCENFWVGIF